MRNLEDDLALWVSRLDKALLRSPCPRVKGFRNGYIIEVRRLFSDPKSFPHIYSLTTLQGEKFDEYDNASSFIRWAAKYIRDHSEEFIP
jgi:hypothetical protein